MMMIANKKFSMFENKEEEDKKALATFNGVHTSIDHLNTMEVEGVSEGGNNSVSIEFYDVETKYSDDDNENSVYINLDVDDARKLSYALQSCLDAIDWAEKQPNK